MKYQQVISMIDAGEGINIEFKQRFSDYEKISKEIIAFANTQGGFILFGVDDNKKVCGVESEKAEAELILECAQKYCEPPIDIKLHFIEIKHKELVIVEIPESKTKPHRMQDYNTVLDLNTAKVFVRVNDKSLPVGKEMIKILQAKSNEKALTNYKLGQDEKQVFEYLIENETINAKELSLKANISLRRASRTLIKLVRAGMLNIHTKDNGENFFTSAV